MSNIEIDPLKQKIIIDIDESGATGGALPISRPPPAVLGLAANKVTPKQKRHFKKKKADKVSLRFFDMNWTRPNKDGSFSELGYVHRLVYPLLENSFQIFQSDYDHLDNLISDIPDKDFSVRFKNTGELITEFRNEKIHNDYFPATIIASSFGDTSFTYSLEETAADTRIKNWTAEKGLELTKDEAGNDNLTIQSSLGNGSSIFDLKNAIITDSFDFHAERVTLEFKGLLDIYIMPKIVATFARHTRDYLTGIRPVPPAAWFRGLNMYVSIRLTFRSPYYDMASPFYKYTIRGDAYVYGDNLRELKETAEVFAHIPDMRTVIIEQDADGHGGFMGAVYTEGDGLAFLTAPDPPEGGVYHTYQVSYFTPIDVHNVPYRLQCIIFQGAKKYYLWEEF